MTSCRGFDISGTRLMPMFQHATFPFNLSGVRCIFHVSYFLDPTLLETIADIETPPPFPKEKDLHTVAVPYVGLLQVWILVSFWCSFLPSMTFQLFTKGLNLAFHFRKLERWPLRLILDSQHARRFLSEKLLHATGMRLRVGMVGMVGVVVTSTNLKFRGSVFSMSQEQWMIDQYDLTAPLHAETNSSDDPELGLAPCGGCEGLNPPTQIAIKHLGKWWSENRDF